MSSPIEDYALIGDGQTAALVNRNGSIDWLCWPRFDSDACLCALLGTNDNGCWLLAPQASVSSVRRRYEDDTLVLETETTTDAGIVRVLDFMPLRKGELSSVVRIVVGVAGSVAMHMDLRLRFDYGALPPWCERTAEGLTTTIGPHRVTLTSPVRLDVKDDIASADFVVTEGQRHVTVLSYSPSDHSEQHTVDPEQALDETRVYWQNWIAGFDCSRTKWPGIVKRSLITLRAMAHSKTGGLVAAPTTSLPEVPGGSMNWDYRYCWLRDSTFTLGAMANAGFKHEAEAWRDWLLRAIAGSPDKMRIMYRVDGARHLGEWSVETLQGYRDARPVRVGNAASTQHQVDVYGEVLDCLSFARRAGIKVTPQQAEVEVRIVDHLAKVWDTPGSGVWESRSEPKQYTYSKVMAWVGVDRVLRDGISEGSLSPERQSQLETLRQTIHDEVCREGWNSGLGTFTQSYGNQVLDASLLLLPLVGFLPANDPRITATISRIGNDLSEGGLIRRKKAKVGGPNEGAFLACSFWMADCLALQGRHDEAVAQFERVIALANDVGLLSEEYDVPAKHLAGNFPQALTHLALINTALSLSGPVLNRAGG
jgi:GH15 family glucan-1,4-alpha-glucosidase